MWFRCEARAHRGSKVRTAILSQLRVAGLVLFIGGLVCILSWTALWYHLFDTLPRAPQPSSGRVHELNMHGVGVYATRHQQQALNLLEGSSYAMLFVGAVGSLLTDPDYRRRMGWRSL